jgi:hypothetical protein
MLKVPLGTLRQAIQGPITHLVCRVSFETRSTSVAKELLQTATVPTTIFASQRRSSAAAKNIKELLSLTGHGPSDLLDPAKPEMTAQRFLELAREVCAASGKVIIDISTFRREELLILLRMLAHSYGPTTDCELVYVEAAEMSSEWLSRGTVGFRSVLGYSGEVVPSRGSHLIVMLGFEVQRARDIIDNYEPTQLTVGYGRREASIRESFHERNLAFFKTLKSWYGRNFSEFQFSLIDPLDTMRDLKDTMSDSTRNVVIAPMNNKLSTLGAGLLGIANQTIQICYSLVSEYNEEEYSTPGEHAYVMSLRDMLSAIGYA